MRWKVSLTFDLYEAKTCLLVAISEVNAATWDAMVNARPRTGQHGGEQPMAAQ